ncbi:hypothetical protein OG21DRAFT_1496920 [Imleria badia]|nr:hypothetical protein OG21DRAFT_1496920 [Imleria badia]
MFTTFFSLSLLALIHSVLAQSTFTVYTPSFVQCQPSNITWSDTGNSPYGLYIASADDICGVALVYFGDQTSTSLTWTVNLAAGTQVVLYVEDAVENNAWSGTITVGDSNDTSCLTSTPSSLATSSSSGTSLTAPPSGGVATSTTSSSSPTSSAYAPVGAAGAGIVPVSGAFSTSPLSSITLLGSALLGALAFTL